MKDLTIIIKTLDRYVCLKPLLKSILKYHKDIPILIGDDSAVSCEKQIKKDFNNKNIKVYKLPTDCGLSYGRNFLVSKVKTKYFCLCDDDFIFDKKTDLEKALEILKEKKVDILGGYIRNYKIETTFKDKIIKLGQKIFHYELPTNYIGTINQKKDTLYVDYKIFEFPEYQESDLVLNFFIAKTKTIMDNPWDNDLKLQEHTAFFYSIKNKNVKVAFTNKLSVRHCPIQNRKYKNLRSRNYTHVFMEKNNLKKIVATFDDEKRNNTTVLPEINPTFISVVIPMYNAVGKIDLLIKSLKEQTYKNFEVIIVDNNSKDNSIEYAKTLIDKDKRFRIEKETKQGPNYARKKGFEKSKGEYIYFCDADDYLEDDTLYYFVCEISKSKSDIIIGNYIEHNKNNSKLMKGVPFDYKGNLKNNRGILHVKPALWNKVFKRDLIDTDSFVFTMIGEDMFITVLSMIRAAKITNINQVVYHYILDDDGLSSKVNYKNFINLIDTQNAIRENLEKIKLYSKWQDEIEYIFITHLVYKIFRVTLLKNKEERKKAYKALYVQLQVYSKHNSYLKKSKAFSLAYIVVSHKLLFKICSPFIKLLFVDKVLNKLFKKLDK